MRNERYDFIHLPEKFHKSHKLCEFLLYQIEDFIISPNFEELKVTQINLSESDKLLDNEHILDFLKRLNRNQEHDKIIISHILRSVIADICQFLQIALFSSMQSRLTVTFSLIRKPFVYDLVLILRLYFTEDFLIKFNNEEKFDAISLPQEDIISLLKISEQTLISISIKADEIYDYIFNAKLSDSIVNISNKALHPSTTRNKENQTEIQNLNFVFSSSENVISQWEYLYRRLPLLLLYLNEVLEFIVFDHLELNDSIFSERLNERADFFKRNSL